MLGDDNLVKIVVVSNDHIMPENLVNMLDSRKYKLETIDPSQRFNSKIGKSDPDIILVDSLGSGEEVISVCKKIRRFGSVPILVLAADHKPEYVRRVLDSGADEYLMKPVSVKILVAHLNTLTRRSRAEKRAAILLREENNGKNGGRLLAY